MSRDPSIHIKKSDLLRILLNCGVSEPSKLCNSILSQAKSYTISSRSIQVNNDFQQRKAKKILASSTDDSVLFSRILYRYRVKLKHRNIPEIKKGSNEWLSIKEVTKQANDFCDNFKLDKKNGYTIYLEIAFSKMNKFALFKMLNMYQGICDTYEALQLIKEDPHSRAETDQAHKAYNKMIFDKTGLAYDYKNMPEKYKYFVLVGGICFDLNISPTDYIQAQFDGFAWRDTVPDPAQLVGDKAKQRLTSYLFKNNIKVKASRQKTVNWSKIMNA